ncbi:MAG TPA: thiamine pyrophosphate-dependent enzyme, partial [Coriobacteriia bacterium]
MVTDPAYRSDTRPDFAPFEESLGSIRGFDFAGDAGSEIAAKRLTGSAAIDLLDDMLAIRELEEMIVRLRSGGYDPLPGYDYRGPTHVSIGQEATSVGACGALRADDHVTSSHRGHGDAIAKGFAAVRTMSAEDLRARAPWSKAKNRDGLLTDALEE